MNETMKLAYRKGFFNGYRDGFCDAVGTDKFNAAQLNPVEVYAKAEKSIEKEISTVSDEGEEQERCKTCAYNATPMPVACTDCLDGGGSGWKWVESKGCGS